MGGEGEGRGGRRGEGGGRWYGVVVVEDGIVAIGGGGIIGGVIGRVIDTITTATACRSGVTWWWRWFASSVNHGCLDGFDVMGELGRLQE